MSKKIVKEVKRISTNTKNAFSSITIRKDKKAIDKNVVETNARLKNCCSQKQEHQKRTLRRKKATLKQTRQLFVSDQFSQVFTIYILR